MLSKSDFIQYSMETNLYFARIMSEHAFLLLIGFPPKYDGLINQANYYWKAYEKFLKDAIKLSNGVVSNEMLQSGELVTPYTLKAESVTSYLTGIQLNLDLTLSELNLVGNDGTINLELEQSVQSLNTEALNLLDAFIKYQKSVYDGVVNCTYFSVNYPHLIEHLIRESELYNQTIQSLQNREDINFVLEVYRTKGIWDEFMLEHTHTIRGLLDITENDLFVIANQFSNQYEVLIEEVNKAIVGIIPMNEVMTDNLNTTNQLRDFKALLTQGLIDCEIRSIMLPLLTDHMLKEANHLIRLLNLFEQNV